MTVIKTVKYPPVQSKHQTPLKDFLLSIFVMYIKKEGLAKYGYKLDMEIKIL
jgi:hypothetical protein